MLDTPHPAAPWSRLQVDDHALGRGTHVEVGTLVGALDLVDLVIGARWIVVEEEQRPRVSALGQAHCVVDRRMPEGGAPGSSAAVYCASCTSTSTSRASCDRAVVVLAQTLGPRAERDRTVVGQVGDGGASVGHAVAERAPALVRDLARERP